MSLRIALLSSNTYSYCYYKNIYYWYFNFTPNLIHTKDKTEAKLFRL